MSALRRHLSTILIVLATVALTSAAPVIAHGVEHAIFAHDSDEVDGFDAVGSGTSLKNAGQKLVATTASGRFSKKFIPEFQVARVVTVAKSGGDFKKVQAAINSITDASAGNRYLVKIAPGAYQGQVTMKPYVDVQGSGENLTIISAPGSGDFAPPLDETATVRGASNAALSFLTVTNEADETSVGFHSNGGSMLSLSHVTLKAKATGTGTPYAYALILSGGNVRAESVRTEATSGDAAFGIYQRDGGTFDLQSFVAHGIGNRGFGISTSDGQVTASSSTFIGEGGSSWAIGVSAGGSTVVLNDVTAEGRGVGAVRRGLWHEYFSGTVRANNSRFIGADRAVVNCDTCTTRIGASQLSGGPSENEPGGTLVCAGVYDENYAFSASSCP